MRWSAPFDDPVPLPGGGELVTLRDAARHIQALPAAEQAKLHWQTAVSILIAAAEGRDFLFHARIAVLQALNHGKPPPVEPRKKAAKAFRIIR